MPGRLRSFFFFTSLGRGGFSYNNLSPQKPLRCGYSASDKSTNQSSSSSPIIQITETMNQLPMEIYRGIPLSFPFHFFYRLFFSRKGRERERGRRIKRLSFSKKFLNLKKKNLKKNFHVSRLKPVIFPSKPPS